jgi:uncharacterized protein YndB with AHSA1/START domain
VPATTITFDLEEPPERVFDYIADVRNELRWQKDLRRAEKTSDGPVGDGTTFDTEYRGFGRMTLTLSEYRRPEHLVFLGDGPRMWMRFVMDVATREGGGSQVTFSIDMRPQGAFKAFTPLLSLGLPKEMAKRPRQFREALAANPA